MPTPESSIPLLKLAAMMFPAAGVERADRVVRRAGIDKNTITGVPECVPSSRIGPDQVPKNRCIGGPIDFNSVNGVPRDHVRRADGRATDRVVGASINTPSLLLAIAALPAALVPISLPITRLPDAPRATP